MYKKDFNKRLNSLYNNYRTIIIETINNFKNSSDFAIKKEVAYLELAQLDKAHQNPIPNISKTELYNKIFFDEPYQLGNFYNSKGKGTGEILDLRTTAADRIVDLIPYQSNVFLFQRNTNVKVIKPNRTSYQEKLLSMINNIPQKQDGPNNKVTNDLDLNKSSGFSIEASNWRIDRNSDNALNEGSDGGPGSGPGSEPGSEPGSVSDSKLGSRGDGTTGKSQSLKETTRFGPPTVPKSSWSISAKKMEFSDED